jgi:intracellular sulfur oxidation DsrE/DsrF family protein
MRDLPNARFQKIRARKTLYGGGKKMKTNPRKIIISLTLLAFVLLVAVSIVSAKEAEALKGVKSAKVIFDVRIANPQSTALHLKLIQQTSKNRQGFAAEEQKSLDEIAETISRMAKEGVRVEICMFAANLLKVDPASILPEIKKVENGWISLIGYQARGYSLVPAY